MKNIQETFQEWSDHHNASSTIVRFANTILAGNPTPFMESCFRAGAFHRQREMIGKLRMMIVDSCTDQELRIELAKFLTTIEKEVE